VERRPMPVRSSKLSASSVAPSICSLRKICWYVPVPQACQYLYFRTSKASKLSTRGLVAEFVAESSQKRLHLVHVPPLSDCVRVELFRYVVPPCSTSTHLGLLEAPNRPCVRLSSMLSMSHSIFLVVSRSSSSSFVPPFTFACSS